jgi:flagellar hook-associated protein 1 FlgK
MSGLYSSLNSAVMALNAHSRAIEITGKNLANVNNLSYARQRILYGDRGTVVTPDGAESLGMEALGVEQLRDSLLDRQVMREAALSSSFSAEQGGYQRAQAALGQSINRATTTNTSGSSGIAAALDQFFNSFQSFAVRPTDSSERQSLLQNAAILTDRISMTDERVAQVQADLDAQIGNDLADANRLLSTIADLNGQIGRFEVNAPGSAVDLRDQRQARLEELATKLPVELQDQSGGQIRVVAKDVNGGDVVLIELNVVSGPVTFDGNQLSAGNPATALAPASGSIKGALSARDGAVETLRNDLDLLARQLVISVNQAYNPTGTTGDFFAASGITAGTIALEGSLTVATLKASDGGPAGDNSVALAVSRLGSKVFSTAAGDSIDGSLGGFYSQTVSKLGQALAGANARVDDQANIEKLVRSQRDALSGVSLDEEMADLLKYQRAFQASSRVFSTIDTLLDVVVNRLGA